MAAGKRVGSTRRSCRNRASRSAIVGNTGWGSWRAINESSSAFWHGFGPGNFPAAYLRHKLPEASEEIKDPHNFAPETWATAGVGALAALLAALGFGFWGAFGPARGLASVGVPPPDPLESVAVPPDSPRAGSSRPRVLVGLVVLFVADFDLIGGGLFDRWMILGAAWALAIACGGPLWMRRPFVRAYLGAGRRGAGQPVRRRGDLNRGGRRWRCGRCSRWP